MSYVVTIEGSLTATAKSNALIEYSHRMIRQNFCQHSTVFVRSLPAEDLFCARVSSTALQDAIALVGRGEGVVIVSPLRHAAYTGLLKAFLDLLPNDALVGKTILPIALTASRTNSLPLEFTLNPVLTALGARSILRSLVIADSQVRFEHGGALHLDERVEQHLRQSLGDLAEAVKGRAERDLVENGLGI